MVTEHQENQMKNLEGEITDLEKAVSEVKTVFARKPATEEILAAIPAPRPEPPPKSVEETDGIRIRGILE